jgi:hypothetical protein
MNDDNVTLGGITTTEKGAPGTFVKPQVGIEVKVGQSSEDRITDLKRQRATFVNTVERYDQLIEEEAKKMASVTSEKNITIATPVDIPAQASVETQNKTIAQKEAEKTILHVPLTQPRLPTKDDWNKERIITKIISDTKNVAEIEPIKEIPPSITSPIINTNTSLDTSLEEIPVTEINANKQTENPIIPPVNETFTVPENNVPIQGVITPPESTSNKTKEVELTSEETASKKLEYSEKIKAVENLLGTIKDVDSSEEMAEQSKNITIPELMKKFSPLYVTGQKKIESTKQNELVEETFWMNSLTQENKSLVNDINNLNTKELFIKNLKLELKAEDETFVDNILDSTISDILNKETKRGILGDPEGVTVLKTAGQDLRAEISSLILKLEELNTSIRKIIAGKKSIPFEDIPVSGEISIREYLQLVRTNIMELNK